MARFIDHVNAVLAKMRQDPITTLSTDTTTDAYKAQVAVNRAVARIWNYAQWSFKLRTSSFSTASGTMDYELPKDVGEPYSVRSNGTAKRLTSVSKSLFDIKIPDPTATGDPSIYVLSDHIGVSEQPSSASVITVASSSALDITQSILIKGTVNGEEDMEELSLNGATSVVGTKQFTSILSVTKSDVTAGRVTLTSNSAAVTNLVLGPSELTVRLRKITLYSIPTSVLTITVHHFALPPRLTHRYEDVLIPERWNNVVDQFSFALALQAKGKDQLDEFTVHMQLANAMLKDDMATEEKISSEEPIVPLKAGDTGEDPWTRLPAGYGYLE